MKKLLLLKSIALLSIVLFASCSKDDSSSTPTPTPTPTPTENIWKLNNYNYARRTSTQTFSTLGNFNIINIDSNVATANAPYTNCNFIITFNTSALGEYLVKTQNTVFTNGTMKYMHIRCQITSGTGTGAVYDSTDSNVAATVTQANGKFVVNITNNVVLTRSSNDGMTNPPATFTLTAQKVQ